MSCGEKRLCAPLNDNGKIDEPTVLGAGFLGFYESLKSWP